MMSLLYKHSGAMCPLKSCLEARWPCPTLSFPTLLGPPSTSPGPASEASFLYFVRANTLLFAHEHLEAPYFKARDFAKGGIKSRERKKHYIGARRLFPSPSFQRKEAGKETSQLFLSGMLEQEEVVTSSQKGVRQSRPLTTQAEQLMAAGNHLPMSWHSTFSPSGWPGLLSSV